MYACLAVTCHLHFWQNDRDFLRATVVTRGWNGYRNKSQHRKSTLEKKILPPFQQGFEPATFQSRVRCSNHWAIPAPLSTLSHTHTINTPVSLHSGCQPDRWVRGLPAVWPGRTEGAVPLWPKKQAGIRRNAQEEQQHDQHQGAGSEGTAETTSGFRWRQDLLRQAYRLSGEGR